MELAQSDAFIKLVTKESRKKLEKKYLDEVAFVQMILRMKEKSSNPNMYWSVIKTRIDRCRAMEETLKGWPMDDIWNAKFWEGPRRRAEIPMPNQDPINPTHYKKEPLVVDVIEGWDLNFNLGCVLKYVARYKEKGGLTDLEKAMWYLEREVGRLSKGVDR